MLRASRQRLGQRHEASSKAYASMSTFAEPEHFARLRHHLSDKLTGAFAERLTTASWT